jgi:DNA-binding transcriptional MocR family regulator
MNIQSKTWLPALPDGAGTLHERLIAALERDIATGVLAVGTRLPPHRDLAHDLGIGVGTVTKAYAEAERRGLLTAHVGRGSFVADGRPPTVHESLGGARIDMANNVPPLAAAEERLAETFKQLWRKPEVAGYAGYAPAGGLPAHRRAAAAWIARTTGFTTIKAENLILCAGAQDATALIAAHLCKPGDTILAEAATFFGMKNLADHAGYQLHGVALDDEGLDPTALDRMAEKTSAKLLYTIPTLQNPTGRTMSNARRAEIVRVARARDLWIIEDDVYGGLVDDKPTALAMLAPERTFYINSASKTLAPGLRTGFLAVPEGDHADKIVRAIRARTLTSSALGSMIATQWIEDGTADAILKSSRAETRARVEIARNILGKLLPGPIDPHCSHIWLPMTEVEAERTAGRAAAAGVDLTSPSGPVLDSASIYGLRLCIGAPRGRAMLETGLKTITAALAGGGDTARDLV